MNEIDKERREGLDWDSLGNAFQEKAEVGNEYVTPLACHFGQLFAMTAKVAIEQLGEEDGEALVREIVERFAAERGRRVAEKVKALGKRCSLKNFLIYGDLEGNLVVSDPMVNIDDGDLMIEVGSCNICKGAEQWGMREYVHFYCKYIDTAIIKAYNPEIELEVPQTLTGGAEKCIFRYRVKQCRTK